MGCNSITLIDFDRKAPKKNLNINKDDEIFKYIIDERILRVLFESRIFKLRDIQKKAIENGLFYRKSFLISAPSGSGKTLIGELCAFNNIFQKYGKTIYLVPFKALATEKYYHFKKSYNRFGIKVELSIGDYDVDDSKLEKADLIITTYEKMDSILRNFYDKEWISGITTIIIDEIHIIGESSRGPRLESLIVRLNEFLNNPQIIGLSATIANPEFFNSWLSSLGNKTMLIKSDIRPVPLHYKIEVSQNKDSTIKRLVRATLEKNGQLLIFLNSRKATQNTAKTLKNLIKRTLGEKELEACKSLENRMIKIKGYN
ncbi:MAG: DEAD/DEAH box helicase, partial [archaeon]|nr:DEAD/DEAH box helicase [archaeon]